MKRRITLVSRVLAIVVLVTSLLSAGYVPAPPVQAGNGEMNVFAGTGVTATSIGELPGYGPGQAIDGALDSKWSYEGGDQLPDSQSPYWLKVDVGNEATVHKFVLAHASVGGEAKEADTRAFSIETSTDDVHWTPVVTVTDSTYGLSGGVSTHELNAPVTARYFKLNITEPGEQDGNGKYVANIYEFAAYGTKSKDESPDVSVTGITLNKPSLQLEMGQSERLAAEITPSTATNATYVWSSDNPAIASVDADGLVTAIQEGTTGITVTTVDGGYKASALVTVVNPNAAVADVSTLIAKNSEWSYLDDGSNQGTAWRASSFDDSAWKKAEASLGYANSSKPQPNTVISYGSDSNNKYITTYFRKSFELADAVAIKQLNGSIIRDDGAVVYLNGTEVFRTENMPAGEITYNTTATNAIGDDRDEVPFSINPSLLVNGTNVIAVEVHQDRGSSSDVFFEMELRGDTSEPPVITADQGLVGQYYLGIKDNDFAFGTLKSTVVDQQINFSNLDPILQARTGVQDNANIRWTAQLMVPETADYTFYMMGDNGFKLWIDDKTVIDHWVNDWDKEQTSAPVRLEAGKKYSFQVDYFEDFGGSNLYLRWSSDNLSKEIVPASAFYLPEGYNGPTSGEVSINGLDLTLGLISELDSLPTGLNSHFSIQAGERKIAVQSVELGANSTELKFRLAQTVKESEIVNVTYDGQGGLKYISGASIAKFTFSPINKAANYAPIAIAMSFYKDPMTKRSFAWYTKYDNPEHAPDNAKDSIVEVVPAGGQFDSPDVTRYVGDPKDTKVLDLEVTRSTRGMFISHKVLLEGLTPGASYQYRVGSEGNWSDIGTFTMEREEELEYEFLYLTDSQGGNSHDYEVWADTLKQAKGDYPNAKFMIMTGDQVDAGSLESQWLDYFGKPQDTLMHLPIMAAVGNHEGPYNDNYYHHFYYPNDSIDDPLPPGSVYSFDYGEAHFMVLNTMDMGWDQRQRDSFKQQIEWLRREVAETDKKWKVVAFHKAIYSVGGHSDEAEIYELRDMLYPVFDELGIDVVLQGHDHTYMRSHQMYGDKPITDLNLDKNGNPVNPGGTMYIVNNASGTKYYDVNQGIDKSYAAYFEQRKLPVYSGIKMTKDSFTIDSYRGGEERPFDSYTIVRTDEKPNPVRNLNAGKTGNGKWALTWMQPKLKDAEDAIRGYRIHEVNGKLGMNWSLYIPAEANKSVYQYIFDNINADEVYEFAVTAVDQRDNSEPMLVKTEGNAAASPINPVVDDVLNTFGWGNAPGFNQLTDYEFTIDGGATWQAASANPLMIGEGEYPAGRIGVRVKAGAQSGLGASAALLSDQPFTNDVYRLEGKLTAGDQLKASVTVDKFLEYSGDAIVVFQLMKGNTPELINAIPIKPNQLEVSQYFNVRGEDYKVKVFVFDRFDGDLNVPDKLATPLVLE